MDKKDLKLVLLYIGISKEKVHFEESTRIHFFSTGIMPSKWKWEVVTLKDTKHRRMKRQDIGED